MVASKLMSLPTELINKIVFYVPGKSDLASLRLTNQTLNAITTPLYFATVPLYADWKEDQRPDPPFPNQVEYDVRFFANILESEKLKRLVRKVEVYTCNPDCDHSTEWLETMWDGEMPHPELSDGWVELRNRLLELPKLESVSLIFDRHAGDSDDIDDEILQGLPERSRELRGFLASLNDRVQDLFIRHLQLESWTVKEAKHDDILIKNAVLEGLRALRLNVVHHQSHSDAGTVYYITDCYERWAEFPSTWLVPASNLRHLTLYSDIPVGWFPRVNFGTVHFAQLETLALGQFIFSNDHHLEWIVSHGTTLQELYLDHCSILYQKGSSKDQNFWLDDEAYQVVDLNYGFPMRNVALSQLPRAQRERVLTLKSYATRWHDVFDLFSRSLPHLRTFRFGSSSQWNFDTPNRHLDLGGSGMPVVPWEVEHNLEYKIFQERYLVWDDWGCGYVKSWEDAKDYGVPGWCVYDREAWGDEEFARFEKYPECSIEDERALKELLKKLGVFWNVRM